MPEYMLLITEAKIQKIKCQKWKTQIFTDWFIDIVGYIGIIGIQSKS